MNWKIRLNCIKGAKGQSPLNRSALNFNKCNEGTRREGCDGLTGLSTVVSGPGVNNNVTLSLAPPTSSSTTV